MGASRQFDLGESAAAALGAQERGKVAIQNSFLVGSFVGPRREIPPHPPLLYYPASEREAGKDDGNRERYRYIPVIVPARASFSQAARGREAGKFHAKPADFMQHPEYIIFLMLSCAGD